MKTKYILTIITLILAITQGKTANISWVGSTSSAWNVSSNWSTNSVPDSADNVTISSGTYNLVLDQNRKVTNLTLSSKTIDLSTYTLTVYGTATMTSGTVTNGTFKCRGTLAAFNGTLMDCPVDAVCGYIRLSGSTFNDNADFTDQGTATGTGSGGCTFNDDVTITHNGILTYFTLANTTGDTFNANVTFTNNSNRELYVATNGSTTFYGNVMCNSTSTGGIVFANSGGTSTLASGKTISIGSFGFSADYLTLKNFTQTGSTAQTLTLTGTAVVNMISCTFNGNLTVTSPGFLLKNNTFNGTATLTRNGSSGNHQSDGGNTFNSSVLADNSGSSGRIRWASTTGDFFNGNATFNSSGNQDVQIAYAGTSEFKGNITVNSNKVVFNTLNGKVTFSGGNSQSINGSYNYSFKKLAINKSANHVTANTTLSVDDTLFFVSGNLITSDTNLLTIKAGSVVTGPSDSSFVSGPVKKIGNTAFEFPLGKNNFLGTVFMSAPVNATDSYVAEYFNQLQNLCDTVDSSILVVNRMIYYKISKISGSSSISIKLKWNESIYDYGADSSNIKILYLNANKWVPISVGSISRSNSRISLPSFTSISNFGFFTIANAGAGGLNTGIVTENHEVQMWGECVNLEHGNCVPNVLGPTYTLYNANSSSTYCQGTLTKLSEIKDLVVGDNQSFAITCDQTLVGWGENTVHQLGNPSTNFPTYAPAGIPVLSGSSTTGPHLQNITSVCTGQLGTLALASDGRIYYWGAYISDVANANVIPPGGSGSSIPTLVTYLSGPVVEDVIAVAAGGFHFLALLRNGTVLAWGRNQFGQVGNGINNSLGERFPVPVLTTGGLLLNIKAISAGNFHSMALAENGRLFCWGFNGNGQVGDGTFVNKNIATLLGSPANIDGIAAGTFHSMAFDGNLIFAWGNNINNQLGLAAGGGSFSSSQSVLLPIGVTDICELKAGLDHSIAITKDRRIFGWGSSYRWQLLIPLGVFAGNNPPYSTPPIEITNNINAFTIDGLLRNCECGINYCYYDYEINDIINPVTTWSVMTLPDCFSGNNLTIENSLLIKKGASLIVNSGVNLFFGPNGRIILEEGDGMADGAQLILNSGSTLTAAGDCMWKGIEVRGNTSFNSSNSRQAKVIINSGAVIENAHNAVTLGKWDANYYACYESQPSSTNPSGFELAGSGGQIECDDATFQNNATDIRFAPYTKLSVSTIENSHFLGGQLRDDRYAATSTNPFNIFYAPKNNSQRASYGIRQLQNFIVEIEGNDFKNYEEALKFTDSRLRVIGNDFEDCRIGINTNSTMSVLIYGGQVEGNTFNNIRIHINAGGGRYLDISNQNEFNPNAASQASNLCAINLNNETAFDIVDNNFTSLRFGIVSNNSGVSGGLIRYRLGPDGNLFTDCWRSIQMQGNNGNLRIRCNTYNNDAGGTNYNTNWFLQNGGLLANQGFFSSTNQSTQAGNWFIQALIRNQIFNSSTNVFTYFRHGAGSPNEVIPALAAGSLPINIDATSIAMSTFDAACDPIVIPTNGEPDRLAFYENVIDSLNLEIDTLVGSIDNQFTDSLVAIIDNFYPQDTILDRLRSNGPLSDTVLIKAINTVDALDDYALYEVLFVNSPYSEEVLNALNGRDPEMDEGLREALNLVQGINYPYITITALNKEIDYYKGDKRLLINSYVTRLSSEDSVQKAIQVLEAENSYEDRQTVFGTYVTMGELDSAATKLELLLTSGLAEADWLELSEILLSLTSDGKTWFDMSDGEANVLREIATQEENSLAKIQSQNVLHLVFGDTFPVMIDDEEIYLRQMQKPKEDTKFAFENDKFQLYPNPANDNVEIRLNNNKEFISHIVLINNLGNIVLNQKIGDKQSASQLNTSHLPSGLYLVKVNATSGTTYSNKLMIVK